MGKEEKLYESEEREILIKECEIEVLATMHLHISCAHGLLV